MDWNGFSPRSHHRANRIRSGTVPLRSHREVVGSFRNDWTQWNRCEHGHPVRYRSGCIPVPNLWCEHGLSRSPAQHSHRQIGLLVHDVGGAVVEWLGLVTGRSRPGSNPTAENFSLRNFVRVHKLLLTSSTSRDDLQLYHFVG